jgi:hypothetical protein
LDINPAKIVKDQGLCKLAVELIDDRTHEDGVYQDQILFENKICYIHVNTDKWYYEIKYNLTHGLAPHYMEKMKKRALRINLAQYQLI